MRETLWACTASSTLANLKSTFPTPKIKVMMKTAPLVRFKLVNPTWWSRVQWALFQMKTLVRPHCQMTIWFNFRKHPRPARMLWGPRSARIARKARDLTWELTAKRTAVGLWWNTWDSWKHWKTMARTGKRLKSMWRLGLAHRQGPTLKNSSQTSSRTTWPWSNS